MSTPTIKRAISPLMPEEFEYRCSACHEQFWEEVRHCDNCSGPICLEDPTAGFTYYEKTHEYVCKLCIASSTGGSLTKQQFDVVIKTLENAPVATGEDTLKKPHKSK